MNPLIITLDRDQVSYLVTLLGYCLKPHHGSAHYGQDQAFPFEVTKGDISVYQHTHDRLLEKLLETFNDRQ
jgi:hypothetical protein